MSNTPSPVVSQAELDAATEAGTLIRYGDVGVTPALLDAGTDHEQRVIALTVADPNDPTKGDIPVGVLIQGPGGLFERLTPAQGEQVTLEGSEEETA